MFVQSEPYYLKQAFKEENMPKILAPIISFSKGLENAEKSFIDVALELKFKEKEAKEDFCFLQSAIIWS